MPRQARRKSESGIYHIMLRGINQQQIFEDVEDYEKFLHILKEYKAISGYKLYAYCLMGNHIHILLRECDEAIDQVIKRIAGRFAYWYNIKYQRTGHLFQDRFKSEPVEDDQYFITVVRYIHQNPIKANLCKNLSDYRFSSYQEFFDKNETIDRDFVFEMIPKNMFEQFHSENANDKCLEISDKPVHRVTDEQAKKIILNYSTCQSVAEFQKINGKEKEKCIKKIHEKGVSIRQIVQLCGEPKSVVEKWVKC